MSSLHLPCYCALPLAPGDYAYAQPDRRPEHPVEPAPRWEFATTAAHKQARASKASILNRRGSGPSARHCLCPVGRIICVQVPPLTPKIEWAPPGSLKVSVPTGTRAQGRVSDLSLVERWAFGMQQSELLNETMVSHVWCNTQVYTGLHVSGKDLSLLVSFPNGTVYMERD